MRTRRDELLTYAGHKIRGAESELTERHHEILDRKKGKFSGAIDSEQYAFTLPVTAVDKLLACPMKFYFETIMKSYPMDQDEVLLWAGTKGDVIHKAFEYFIEGKGYGLDLEPALTLMSACLDKALDEKGIDKNDSLQLDHFRNYIRNLSVESDNNCLVLNLKMIKEKYSDYNRFESEKSFDDFDIKHPHVAVNLKGKIDKIMLNDKEKKLIVSDFKTGKITASDLSKKLLSQLYLYLQYSTEKYPEYDQKAMYEIMKDTKKYGTAMIELRLDEGEIKLANSKLPIEEFEKHLQDIFSQIAEGKYYITEKDFNDACKNCPHESLCRKNTRIRT